MPGVDRDEFGVTAGGVTLGATPLQPPRLPDLLKLVHPLSAVPRLIALVEEL